MVVFIYIDYFFRRTSLCWSRIGFSVRLSFSCCFAPFHRCLCPQNARHQSQWLVWTDSYLWFYSYIYRIWRFRQPIRTCWRLSSSLGPQGQFLWPHTFPPPHTHFIHTTYCEFQAGINILMAWDINLQWGVEMEKIMMPPPRSNYQCGINAEKAKI